MSAPLSPDRIRELLGGYATGTLTPEEHAALMQAALEDQALFDQLMDEEALRDALSDRAFRAELMDALQPRGRWWRAPWPWAALATATAAAALFVLLRPQPQPQVVSLPEASQQVAALRIKPEPVPSEIPVPRTLRMETPAAPAAPPAAKTVARRDAAAAQPEQAAPAPAAAVSDQMRAVVTEAAPVAQLAAADAMKEEARSNEARSNEAARSSEAKKGGEAASVELAAQSSDGSWRVFAPGAALPAGRPLRLRFTPEVSGTLTMEPGLAPPLTVQAGVPAEWLLPAQARGDLVLRLSYAAPARLERMKARAAADSAVGGVAANRPAAAPREIRLRIE